MKAILISPPYTTGSTWGAFKAVGGYNPPLGLCYLAASLDKNGVEVRIDDAYVQGRSFNQILEGIDEFSPDFVGITSASVLFSDTRKLTKLIKKNYKVPVLIGGPHVTIFPEDAMKNDLFLCGVIGEGEKTIAEIVEFFRNERSLESVKGIVYKENGVIKKTSYRPLEPNLDNIPMPSFDILPPLKTYYPQAFTYRKRPVGYVMSSRGCPFRCIYCIRIMGQGFRTHSPERVVGEIEMLVNNFGAKEIHFTDDCFAINKKRVSKICDLIIKKRLKINWKCITHVNSLDYELLKEMKKSGCWYIGVGVETGDPRMMKFIKKNINLKHLEKVVKWCDSLGIAVKGFFILGFPSETTESLKRTVDFAVNNPFFAASFNIAYLNPGSEMDEIADGYGIVSRKSANVTAYSKELSFVANGFTPEKLKNAQRNAYLRFYLRPTLLLRMLRLNRNYENYLRGFQTVLSLLWRFCRELIVRIKKKFKYERN